jgi:hypothetical protein
MLLQGSADVPYKSASNSTPSSRDTEPWLPLCSLEPLTTTSAQILLPPDSRRAFFRSRYLSHRNVRTPMLVTMHREDADPNTGQ